MRQAESGRKARQRRLTTPMVRIDGRLEAATWDDALGLITARMSGVMETFGPDALGMFACSKTTNELNYAAQKLMRAVVGTNNIDSCNRT